MKPLGIGTEDGYWYALLEKQRIMEVCHRDKEIARTFYDPNDPLKTFNRVIERHRKNPSPQFTRPLQQDHEHEP